MANRQDRQPPGVAMPYRELLPDGCPPEEAEEIAAPRIVYRLVWNSPPSNDDFGSQRALKPFARFNVSECRARGLSVYARRGDAINRSRKRALRGTLVCRVSLQPGAGSILKTGGGSHYTWWPLADFDILANSR